MTNCPLAQSIPLTAPPGDPAIGGAPPGAPPEGPPFQSALEAEWARTAVAEGQQQNCPEGRIPTSPDGEETSSSPTSSSGEGVAHSEASQRTRRRGGAAGPAVPGTTAPGNPVQGFATHGAVHANVATARTEALTLDNEAPGDIPPASAQGASASGDASIARVIASPTPVTASPAQTTAGSAPTLSTPGSPLAGEALPGGLGDSGGANGGQSPNPGWVGSAPTLSTPGSPLAGEALPGGLGDSGGANGGQSPNPGRVGSDSTQRWVGPGLGATLSSTAATAGSTVDTGWSSQAGAHRPAGSTGLRSAGGTGAHDKLWVPDPGWVGSDPPTGADADTGGVAAGGVGGLAEGSGPAQASLPPGGNRSEIGQQGPLLDYGVGLQQAIDTLHGTIQLAARQGLSQARIALEPEGLGEIRIHLTQTAQGLLARVSAETPVAAQALAAAHAELRQSLSSLGLNLARLSIGRHGHTGAQGGGTALGGGHDGAAGSGEASSRGNHSGQTAASAASTDPTPDSDAEEDAQPESAPSHGALVDVLA